jgi:hypothetical protein
MARRVFTASMYSWVWTRKRSSRVSGDGFAQKITCGNQARTSQATSANPPHRHDVLAESEQQNPEWKNFIGVLQATLSQFESCYSSSFLSKVLNSQIMMSG